MFKYCLLIINQSPESHTHSNAPKLKGLIRAGATTRNYCPVVNQILRTLFFLLACNSSNI